MSRNSFAGSDVTRIYLDDAKEEWFEAKDELNAGEDRKQAHLALVPFEIAELDGEGRPVVGEDGKPVKRIIDRIDWSDYELLRANLWITAWHIHDKKGNVPTLSLDAIRALKTEVFNHMNLLLYGHIMGKIQEKKKGTTIPTLPPTTATSDAPKSE